tara:strand:+ start:1344 stop:1832 length:489 start_codon:yes stop_codon:yes gene_type:complete
MKKDWNDSTIIGVQKYYAPSSICFGCGPSNKKGLMINSTRFSDGLELWFMPRKEHQAFPGVINGGIIGTIFDCHGNWTAAVGLLDAGKFSKIPYTVTSSFSVNLLRPTPTKTPLFITAKVDELMKDRASVSMKLFADKKLCARGKGLFVSVKEGHPAFNRWH